MERMLDHQHLNSKIPIIIHSSQAIYRHARYLGIHVDELRATVSMQPTQEKYVKVM